MFGLIDYDIAHLVTTIRDEKGGKNIYAVMSMR